jgi:peptidoglycan L-alanyl-D-glutamate endopeptidase CwlK
MTQRVFSKRSEENLKGVNDNLVAVVRRALLLSSVDFTVVEGLRTVERQKQQLAIGASKTMNSRHIAGEAFR